MALVIDETDPCAAAVQLREVYTNIVAGKAAMTVSFKAGASGVERSVTYNKADPDRLLKVIRGYEAQCAALTGCRPARYALRGGGM